MMFLFRRELSAFLILAASILTYASPSSEAEQAFEVPGLPAIKSNLVFDVSTVKLTKPDFQGWRMNFTQNGFIAQGVTLNTLAMEAYGAYEPGCFKGAEGWAAMRKFDVEAKIDPQDVPNFAELSLANRRTMLQRLLKDRFALAAHVEHTKKKVLVLTIIDGSEKLLNSSSLTDNSDNHIEGLESTVTASSPGHLEGKNFTLANLAKLLEAPEQRIIVANSTKAERFDFKLTWASDDSAANPDPNHVSEERAYSGGADSLLTALRKQLGLALIPDSRVVDVIVLDNVQAPKPD